MSKIWLLFGVVSWFADMFGKETLLKNWSYKVASEKKGFNKNISQDSTWKYRLSKLQPWTALKVAKILKKIDQKWQIILHHFIMQKGLGLEDESMVILNACG